MTTFELSIVTLVATVLLNGLVAVSVYSIRTTITTLRLEVQNALLLLHQQIANDVREEFATKEQFTQLASRVDEIYRRRMHERSAAS